MVEILKTLSLEPIDVPMIAVCAVLFLVLWKSLNKTLFAPHLALIETRERLTTGASTAAQEIKNKADQILSGYNSKIMNARVDAMQRKLEVLAAAKAEGAKIFDSAEAEAQELLRKSRWDTAQKLETLKSESFKDAEKMADAIVAKLIAPINTTNKATSVN